jgi:hypothetical protein
MVSGAEPRILWCGGANSDIANCDGSPHAYDDVYQWNPGSNISNYDDAVPVVTLVALLGRMLL